MFVFGGKGRMSGRVVCLFVYYIFPNLADRLKGPGRLGENPQFWTIVKGKVARSGSADQQHGQPC